MGPGAPEAAPEPKAPIGPRAQLLRSEVGESVATVAGPRNFENFLKKRGGNA